jgi:hypothetical protein
MLVAIRPEKEFGKWLYSFSAKDYSCSQSYLSSRSAKRLLQAEGEGQVASFLRSACRREAESIWLKTNKS